MTDPTAKQCRERIAALDKRVGDSRVLETRGLETADALSASAAIRQELRRQLGCTENRKAHCGEQAVPSLAELRRPLERTAK